MMFPSNRVRVLVSTQPVDFRKGHDGLAALVSSVLRKDPFTGTVFVFRSRRADRLKLLYWDGTGLVMAYKRLEDSTFTWPAIKAGIMALNHAQFEALFAGLDWRKVKALERRAHHLRQSESTAWFCVFLLGLCGSSGLCKQPPFLIFLPSRFCSAQRFWH
tara:strand:- start:767 stop:1246 length:480 start_codon:yes stop_codon:yes gene_type:complete